jgi:trans-2,3-dihydro-3-hydroxyanthranilate isomerase
MPHPIHIVDVFSTSRYTGNPLAVVDEAGDLSGNEMLRVAAEMNFSETTFHGSTPEDDGSWLVRIFTPARELAFAGHPILGTAWVIRERLGPDRPDHLRLRLPVGTIPVTFERGPDGHETAWFLAPPVDLGPVCDPVPMAAALHLEPRDLDLRAPIRQATAGVSLMIVPVRSLAALGRARLDLQAYAPLAEAGFPPLVYVFCPETHQPGHDFCARFFFEAHGVREDPAAGNATAFLGAYLLEHPHGTGPELDLRIEQGHRIGRPSLLLLRARRAGAAREIRVGGQVLPALQGVLV